VLGRLAQGGHPAFLSPVEVRGQTMYRVRIGPYVERSAAEQVATTVRRDFKLDTWITSKST
jgi:cell division septation protein DedD